MTEGYLKVYAADADERTIQQAFNCIAVEEGARGVLCADAHLGYSQPIGMAVAYRDHISPSGVGYDIGCGNKAVRTNLMWNEISGDVPKLMDAITTELNFGVGMQADERVDHPVLDEISAAEFAPQRSMRNLAAKQLGTIGAGNHYVDLFVDTGTDAVWIGVHFGSRGFGHKTASGFLALAEGKGFFDAASEGEMMSAPVVFHIDSGLGQSYMRAMELAGRYAHAGRDIVVDKVRDILGTTIVEEVHNHHNYAWRESHGSDDFWVVRKGCTPAWPGQQGFVGATMGENSVILEGTHTAHEALWSTVHGAGRPRSRTASGGKWRRRWSCQNRECDWYQGKGEHKPEDGACPKCGHPKIAKAVIQMTKGTVDWEEAKADLARRGIVLKGGAADEAPGAYKRLDEVLEAQGETIKVTRTLRPVGVAMAGPGVNDPYK